MSHSGGGVRRKIWVTMIVVAFLACSAGCSTIVDGPTPCERAFDQVDPIPAGAGLFFLVSDDFAQTLNGCGSVEEWTSELQARPETVSQDALSTDDILGYLAGGCELLQDTGAGSVVCDQAYDEGLIPLR